MTERPKCIVCGRAIKKRIHTLSFIPATANCRENGARADNGRTIYLDKELRPSNKEEAQRYTNHQITKVTMHDGRVYSIEWWEGEYMDPYFDRQVCARKQGYASAQHGERYTWKDAS